MRAICRITCGWKLPQLDLARVRPYWRDAHSPAIARRDGIYEYRHYPLDPVQPDLFAPVDGIVQDCPADAQLMWMSDVRYTGEESLAAFGRSPGAGELKKILGDIDMIVDRQHDLPRARRQWAHAAGYDRGGRPVRPRQTRGLRRILSRAARTGAVP